MIEALHDQTGKTTRSLANLLDQDVQPLRRQKIFAACEHDESLWQRVRPFANLIRDDSFGRPVVIAGGRLYVTSGEERRATGTHYTPRSLTESIVQHALEPLVFYGPAEGQPKPDWQLKKPSEILDLKIVDMAMGSAPFWFRHAGGFRSGLWKRGKTSRPVLDEMYGLLLMGIFQKARPMKP